MITIMKHYYLSIFLAILMSMAYTMASAHDIAVANSDGKTIYYVKNSNGSSVSVTYRGTSYSSYSNEYTGDVVIPETVTYSGQTYNVTSIGSSAFKGCSGLTSVTIPNNVTSIGFSAFNSCSGLPSVIIGNSVTNIGSSAFESCSGLTSVTIPNSVKSIDPYAFRYCRGLTSLTIPNSVTNIGEQAFQGCSGLTSVTIPNSVTSIGALAFYQCSGLTSITWNAKSCLDFSQESSSPFYYIRTQITEFIIGDVVTNIPAYLCDGMSNLNSVTIGNNVTSIGKYAFYGCSGLTSVTIGNSVTSIGSSAFKDANLNSIYSYIESPTSSTGSSFDISNYINATLYVPYGTKEKYLATDGWKNFTNIVEMSETALKKVSASNIDEAKFFSLDGKIISQPQKGLNILKMSDGTTRKIIK